jgi:DNA-binding NarL/FixJ family response regulator
MISIYIVDDHKIVRDGLKAALLGYPEFKVVGEASTGELALKELPIKKPDVVFVDLRLPDVNGAMLIGDIMKLLPEAKCLLLTAEPNVTDLERAKLSGAMGFLTKDIDTDEYVLAIRKVLRGEKHSSATFSHIFLNSPADLTNRELEVLQLFADGLAYKQIADKLDISARTVETHKINILKKLGVDTPIEMVRKAIKLGLIKA